MSRPIISFVQTEITLSFLTLAGEGQEVQVKCVPSQAQRMLPMF